MYRSQPAGSSSPTSQYAKTNLQRENEELREKITYLANECARLRAQNKALDQQFNLVQKDKEALGNVNDHLCLELAKEQSAVTDMEMLLQAAERDVVLGQQKIKELLMIIQKFRNEPDEANLRSQSESSVLPSTHAPLDRNQANTELAEEGAEKAPYVRANQELSNAASSSQSTASGGVRISGGTALLGINYL